MHFEMLILFSVLNLLAHYWVCNGYPFSGYKFQR